MKYKYKLTTVKIFMWILLLVVCYNDVEAASEEEINKIEVFVSAYCYRLNRALKPEILLLKRFPNKELHPNAWECCSGSVQKNESFEKAAKRQLFEKVGITATRWKMLECFETNINPEIIIPGLIFACKANLNAKVKIDPREHVDFRWVTMDDLDNFPLVNQQMRQSIIKLLMIQSKRL
ncbi:MAG: NUDIX domain-containing protein [Puniceicoccales bacterium]|jgi:8-oxo-dGTP pyrophosphatase MutT (NUDIX family)|nr:NUDIX domain-containing protein [Puniceicoccales bacterium]